MQIFSLFLASLYRQWVVSTFLSHYKFVDMVAHDLFTFIRQS